MTERILKAKITHYQMKLSVMKSEEAVILEKINYLKDILKNHENQINKKA